MNGRGEGQCSFTNTGTAPGSTCGKITVSRADGRTVQSSTFCSGEVPKQSTTKVEFSIPTVNALCGGVAGKTWQDVCIFTFDNDSTPPRAVAAAPPALAPTPSSTDSTEALGDRARAATAKLTRKVDAGTVTQADIDEANAELGAVQRGLDGDAPTARTPVAATTKPAVRITAAPAAPAEPTASSPSPCDPPFIVDARGTRQRNPQCR